MILILEQPINSNPYSKHSDGDGLEDNEELHFSRATMTYELDKSQYDGSVFVWSDPCLEDTDGDGILDGDDVYPLEKLRMSPKPKHWNEINFNMIIDINRILNKKYDVDDFIYGQKISIVKEMEYCLAFIKNVGCELIAIYNATKLLGGDPKLSDIIYEFELNPGTKYWADIINSGYFGTQPEKLGGYLYHHGYKYEYTEDLNKFASWRKSNRVFIMSFWNSDSIFKGLHTVAVQADENGTYSAYNLNSLDTKVSTNKSLEEILENREFICGYYLPKS